MLIYVDGDNAPGTRTAGIDALRKTDIVKVFYANNSNKFYGNKNNRDKLASAAPCDVVFQGVAQAADSADFAIAIDCAKQCCLGETKVVCLVSQDKHFDTIRRQIEKLYDDVTIRCAASIKEGFAMLNVLEVKRPGELERSLTKLYGVEGKKAFENIKNAFVTSYKEQYLKNNKCKKWFSRVFG